MLCVKYTRAKVYILLLFFALFVRTGICVVDQTEKGWFIQYIDRNWEAIKKQEALQVCYSGLAVVFTGRF